MGATLRPLGGFGGGFLCVFVCLWGGGVFLRGGGGGGGGGGRPWEVKKESGGHQAMVTGDHYGMEYDWSAPAKKKKGASHVGAALGL